MTMSAFFELDSFLLKFKSLHINGFKTSLKISSESGRLFVSFDADLGPCSPQFPPPDQRSTHHKKRNASYYRRQARRRANRNRGSVQKADNSSAISQESNQERDKNEAVVQKYPTSFIHSPFQPLISNGPLEDHSSHQPVQLLKVSTKEVLPRCLEGGIKNFSRLAAD